MEPRPGLGNRPPVSAAKPPAGESRGFQILIGIGGFAALAAFMTLLWLGRHLPGFLGEWFGTLAGILTTPIFMEASFLVFGILLVMAINHWRRAREGDEFVYLDLAQGPGSELLPEQARWAIYPEAPLVPENPDLLSRAEGALEIGDHDSVIEALAAMTDDERNQPATLRLRARLARATGRTELAERLEALLDPDPPAGPA